MVKVKVKLWIFACKAISFKEHQLTKSDTERISIELFWVVLKKWSELSLKYVKRWPKSGPILAKMCLEMSLKSDPSCPYKAVYSCL